MYQKLILFFFTNRNIILFIASLKLLFKIDVTVNDNWKLSENNAPFIPLFSFSFLIARI